VEFLTLTQYSHEWYYLYWSHVLVYMRVGVYVSYKFVPPLLITEYH